MVLHQQQNTRELCRVLAQAFKPDFSADNRLDTALACLFVKLDGTKQVAQIADSQRRLGIGNCKLDAIINAIGTVNDGEFSVQAQMDKHSRLL
ncbi:hypothetical protein GALL_488530 [mine drainage metagenome]|uniref:Uncharacterized protein n=1 Tax=mine drainage metagenome TaxID=410659 RepID=A0A1J5PP42_9ZZZZ